MGPPQSPFLLEHNVQKVVDIPQPQQKNTSQLRWCGERDCGCSKLLSHISAQPPPWLCPTATSAAAAAPWSTSSHPWNEGRLHPSGPRWFLLSRLGTWLTC